MVDSVTKRRADFRSPFFVPVDFVFSSMGIGALVCAWMVSGLPLPWASWETRYDDARAIQLVALIALLIGLFARPLPLVATWQDVPKWARVTVSLCGLLGVLSALRSQYPLYAFVECATLTALVIAGLGLASAADHPGRRVRVGWVVLAGAVALGWRLFAELLAVAFIGDAGALRYSWYMFINPRYFAKVVTWLLPLFWLGCVTLPERWKLLRVIFVVLASILAAHLLMTGSRAALWAMLISVAVCAVTFGASGRRIARAHLLYLVLGCALWAGVEWIYGGATLSDISRSGSSGRDVLIRESIAHVAQAPWLGIGPMQFAVIDLHSSAAAPHNAVLQLAAEWGVPVALCTVALVLMCLYRYALRVRAGIARGNAESDVCWNVAVFAAILAALGQSLVANVLTDPISQTLFVVFVGVASQTLRDRQPATKTPDLRWTHHLVVRGLVLIVALTLGLALLQGKRCVGTGVPTTYSAGADGRIWPRYWSQGYIPLEQTCRPANE